MTWTDLRNGLMLLAVTLGVNCASKTSVRVPARVEPTVECTPHPAEFRLKEHVFRYAEHVDEHTVLLVHETLPCYVVHHRATCTGDWVIIDAQCFEVKKKKPEAKKKPGTLL